MAGKKHPPAPVDVLRLRRLSGMSQQDFWAPIGISQSGGCRYENGRRMPVQVAKLVQLVHVDGIKHPEAVLDLVKAAKRAAALLELIEEDERGIEVAEQLEAAIKAVTGGAK